MTIRMTEEQARKAGLLKDPSTSKRKGMGRGGAKSRCAACGEEFTGDAAETRHLEETKHARYETVIEP